MAQKGGRKLRRSSKHSGMYQAQFLRTERNKAAAKSRIARRKRDNPSPGRNKTRAANREARRFRTEPEVQS